MARRQGTLSPTRQGPARSHLSHIYMLIFVTVPPPQKSMTVCLYSFEKAIFSKKNQVKRSVGGGVISIRKCDRWSIMLRHAKHGIRNTEYSCSRHHALRNSQRIMLYGIWDRATEQVALATEQQVNEFPFLYSSAAFPVKENLMFNLYNEPYITNFMVVN